MQIKITTTVIYSQKNVCIQYNNVEIGGKKSGKEYFMLQKANKYLDS